MYRVVIIYEDQNFREYFKINKIEYSSSNGYVTVEGNEVLSCKFPLAGVYVLYSEDGVYSVSLKNSRSFEVTRES